MYVYNIWKNLLNKLYIHLIGEVKKIYVYTFIFGVYVFLLLTLKVIK